MTIHYSSCPVCGGAQINPLLTVRDHSVSKEDFVIWQCATCTLRFTQDAPDEESMNSYYKSEEYISHSNTSKGLVNKLYQTVRSYTLKQKADLIIAHTKIRGNILDVGAGTGAFLQAMKDKNWNAAGIEPDYGAREVAKKLYNIRLLETEQFQKLPQQHFDAITLWHVLEHVHELHPYMEQLKNLLSSSGRIFIAVPNYSSVDAGIYRNNWAAYDVPRHLYHFTPQAMETLLQKHGLKLIEKKPMWFDAFYISLLSSKYKNGGTNWLGSGLAALRSNIKAFADKDACSSLIYVVGKN